MVGRDAAVDAGHHEDLFDAKMFARMKKTALLRQRGPWRQRGDG